MNTDVLIIVSCLGIILSTVALILSSVAIAIFVGLKNSTHQVQYVPFKEDNFSDLGKQDKEFDEDHV